MNAVTIDLGKYFLHFSCTWKIHKIKVSDLLDLPTKELVPGFEWIYRRYARVESSEVTKFKHEFELLIKGRPVAIPIEKQEIPTN